MWLLEDSITTATVLSAGNLGLKKVFEYSRGSRIYKEKACEQNFCVACGNDVLGHPAPANLGEDLEYFPSICNCCLL